VIPPPTEKEPESPTTRSSLLSATNLSQSLQHLQSQGLQPSITLIATRQCLLQLTLEIGLVHGQLNDIILELVASIATRTPQHVRDPLLLHNLLLQLYDLLSEHSVIDHHGVRALDLALHHRVQAVEVPPDPTLAGEGVSGADELAAQVLGELDEVRVAAGHDGISVLDVELVQKENISMRFDQILSLENLHGSLGELQQPACGSPGVRTSPRSES
jgi:hypothetical protein